jgi:hypothetical protein
VIDLCRDFLRHCAIKVEVFQDCFTPRNARSLADGVLESVQHDFSLLFAVREKLSYGNLDL